MTPVVRTRSGRSCPAHIDGTVAEKAGTACGVTWCRWRRRTLGASSGVPAVVALMPRVAQAAAVKAAGVRAERASMRAVERQAARLHAAACAAPPGVDPRTVDGLGGGNSGFCVRALTWDWRQVDDDDRAQDRALAALEARYRQSILDKMEQIMSVATIDLTADGNVKIGLTVDPFPDEADGFTKHFTLGESDGYLKVACYPDGRPGLVSITMAKSGDSERAYLAACSDLATKLLQTGVPIDEIVGCWRGTRFAPSGPTGEGAAGIPQASSPLDYVARFLARRFEGEQ